MSMLGKLIDNAVVQVCQHRQNPDKRNVFLISTPRSGSTWLMELIATERGFKYVNEPFNIRAREVRDNLDIDSWHRLNFEFCSMQSERYLQSFVDGSIRDGRYARPRIGTDLWRTRTDRIVFKILFAGETDIGWFGRSFNSQVVLLLRHPIPVSLSRQVLPRLESFLRPEFLKHFSASQQELAESIYAKGSELEKAVLDWCLQNALPLRQAGPDTLVLTYEQLVLDPEPVITTLCDFLDLDDRTQISARLQRMSASTRKRGHTAARELSRDATYEEIKDKLLSRWRDSVSVADIERVYEILEGFDIDVYSSQTHFPQQKYLVGAAAVCG